MMRKIAFTMFACTWLFAGTAGAAITFDLIWADSSVGSSSCVFVTSDR